MASSKRPRGRAPVSLARAQNKKPGSAAWYGLAAAVLASLVLLWLTVMVVGSYLAPVFGRGWPWFGATLLLALGVPAAVGLWLVRPLEGFKRAAWFTGACVILPTLVVVGLSAGTPSHTAAQLRKHGHWPTEQVFGPPTQSSATRLTESLATTWADLLARPGKKQRKTQVKTVAEPQKRPVEPRKRTREVFYTGVLRARHPPPPPRDPRDPGLRSNSYAAGGRLCYPPTSVGEGAWKSWR